MAAKQKLEANNFRKVYFPIGLPPAIRTRNTGSNIKPQIYHSSKTTSKYRKSPALKASSAVFWLSSPE